MQNQRAGQKDYMWGWILWSPSTTRIALFTLMPREPTHSPVVEAVEGLSLGVKPQAACTACY